MPSPVSVRPASAADLPAVGKLAADLVRYHHALDDRRFLLVEGVAEGYARYFASQLGSRETIVLVAERDGVVVGYAYGRLEPRDWNALLDVHGALHDVFVLPEARRSGIAAALIEEIAARLTALGAPRLVLTTATQNLAAQSLFERHGFRRTMIEMTRELGG